ncbi:MAG: type IX secretion system membrane protein PorP/SprF [Prevotellaceae bacterium]|nr:type IX secretion system membrane protein PorP/SprF [Prevotellaceae bacterium]
MVWIKCFIVTGLMAFGLQANAQGQGYIDIGQKWLYRPFINPAVTGNTPFLELNLFARKQWVGIEGAPSTQIFSGHSFLPTINSGVGLTVVNEFIGIFHTIDIKLAYAYHILLDRDIAISFGLAGNATWMYRDDSKIIYQAPPTIPPPPFKTTVLPNFDAGIEIRNAWLKVGLSAIHLIDAHGDYSSNPGNFGYNTPDVGRTFYAYATSRVEAGTYLAVSPSLLGSLNHGFYDGEAGAMFFFKRLRQKNNLVRLRTRYSDTYDFLWAGAFMRFSGTLAMMAGVSITEQWRVGYAYEYTFQLRQIHWANSHEIMLSWRLPPLQRGPRKYLCDDC